MPREISSRSASAPQPGGEHQSPAAADQASGASSPIVSFRWILPRPAQMLNSVRAAAEGVGSAGFAATIRGSLNTTEYEFHHEGTQLTK